MIIILEIKTNNRNCYIINIKLTTIYKLSKIYKYITLYNKQIHNSTHIFLNLGNALIILI